MEELLIINIKDSFLIIISNLDNFIDFNFIKNLVNINYYYIIINTIINY